jgi:peptidoglycan-N-acetylglucosamine deacetylase
MSLPVLLIAFMALCPEEPEPLPEKTVVLTFDDSVRSHLTFVAPLLREHGFGATFFVTNAWMHDTGNYLTWDEVAALHRMGFEVGNHTWNHVALHEEGGGVLAEEETRAVEEALAAAGVPRCTSLSWPGNHFGPEARDALRRLGYRFARRGTLPEGGPPEALWMGPLYDPEVNDPLLVPTTGLAMPEWTLDDFRRVVDRAEKGMVAVLQFHGVPDGRHPFCSTPPERFREFMQYLADNGFTVIAMRDLARYVPAEPRPGDPVYTTRFFK